MAWIAVAFWLPSKLSAGQHSCHIFNIVELQIPHPADDLGILLGILMETMLAIEDVLGHMSLPEVADNGQNVIAKQQIEDWRSVAKSMRSLSARGVCFLGAMSASLISSPKILRRPPAPISPVRNNFDQYWEYQLGFLCINLTEKMSCGRQDGSRVRTCSLNFLSCSASCLRAYSSVNLAQPLRTKP
jgi:hypothetical protein